ncbi:hypothetical protein B9Z55_012196 [Caenorhabditis nigoni]|uniref:Galectin n=1 Tax=Caenorhabditis nigoni TaxID=1611254 RepID=A0A2G5TWN0_9PELO|nr:hypothetical protein B9Z55_012196 [Caenorhabditis nigoni]
MTTIQIDLFLTTKVEILLFGKKPDDDINLIISITEKNIAFKSFYHFTDDIEESRQFPNTDGPFLALQIAADEEGFIIRALGTGWVKRYDHRLPLSNIQYLVITGSYIQNVIIDQEEEPEEQQDEDEQMYEQNEDIEHETNENDY